MNQNGDDEQIALKKDEQIHELAKEKKQQQIQEHNEGMKQAITFTIVYNLIWGILFAIFRYINDEVCFHVELWTLIIMIYLFGSVLFKIIFQLPQALKSQTQSLQRFKLEDSMETIICFILMIGLTFAYFQFEDCSTLRNFSLVYLVLSYLTFIVTATTMLVSYFKGETL
ncbi:hypothetical protein pb186bvf_005456 [Paramecium bursaria]